MSSVSRSVRWLACLVFVAAIAHPSIADTVPNRRFVVGDTVTGTLDFAGDADEATFAGLRGMKVKFKGIASVSWTPVVDLRDSSDVTLKTRRSPPKGGRAPSYSGKLATSGEFRLRISGPEAATGDYQIVTSATLPTTARKRTKRVKPTGADLTAALSVDLLPQATLDVTATPSKATPALTMTIETPNGGAIDVTAVVQRDSSGRLRLHGYAVDSVGTYTVRISGFTSKKQSVALNLVPAQPTGASKLALTESILSPDTAPAVFSTKYAISAGVTIGSAAQPVVMTTAVESGTLGGGGASLEGLRPDSTQVDFLVDPEGRPYAPFVVRPSDAIAALITIDDRRLALGVLALHPATTRLGSLDREAFLDKAPLAATFPFLRTAVRDALASNPLGLTDAAEFPEVFQSADKVATETFAQMPWVKATSFTSSGCGTLSVPKALSVYAGSSANAVVVNPRFVFYGVSVTGPTIDGRTPAPSVYLVKPREGYVQIWPPGLTDPGVRCDIALAEGESQLVAAASIQTITDDLSTPGGLATATNGLYALFQILGMAVPLPVPSADLAELTSDYLLRGGDVPNGKAVLTKIGEIGASGTPGQMLDVIEAVIEDHWSDISSWILRRASTKAEQAAAVAVRTGAVKFFKAYTDIGLLGAVNDAAPFLSDLMRTGTEGRLTYCATRVGSNVTITCPQPFTFNPDFTFTPSTPAVFDTVSFDPAMTVASYSDAPPTPPTFSWRFYDEPGADPVVVSTGTSSAPVQHAFGRAGFHMVMLDVTIGNVTLHAFRSAPVEAFPNLGFESASAAFWTVETHTWGNSTPGSASGHSAIMLPAFDPIANALATVFSGGYSLRIEDGGSGSYISSASRVVRVPTGGISLKFAWAAVLEDPGHAPTDQPYFDIQVRDVTTGQTLYSIHHYAGEAGFPWQNADTFSDWKFVPWQPVTLDLAGHDGDTVVISAIGADCALGGHGGYVYLDAP